jgi:hypothetical protein
VLEPTNYHIRGEHVNHYTTDAVVNVGSYAISVYVVVMVILGICVCEYKKSDKGYVCDKT